MNSRFNVISTFAGCGGSSLGYRLAGGKVLLAVEWDDNAVETYRLNFPETPVYHGDIGKLTAAEALALTGLKPGELDILDGSPPCQGFSTAGKRMFLDSRNQLFKEYVRLLDGLKPKVFVMENVSGMVKGKMKLIFAEIIRELKSKGYKVSARLMNTAYFNVPQNRKRIIFTGVRDDLGIEPSHPKAKFRPITFKEACYDLRGNTEEDRMLPPVIKEIAKYQPDKWDSDDRIWKKIKGNLAGSISTKWAGWNRICGTIVKSEIALSGIVHPDRERYLSLAEMKRVTSFPDDFIFTGRKKGVERIGNSVPPNFMRSVAEHIRDEILSKIK